MSHGHLERLLIHIQKTNSVGGINSTGITLLHVNIEFCHSAVSANVLIFEINSRNIKVSETLIFEQEGETVVLDVRRLI